MQICRVEHKVSGLGPYNHLFSYGRLLETVGVDNGLPDPYCEHSCPPPFTDKKLAFRYLRDEATNKWRFGFADLNQLSWWFSGNWPQVLHDEGFHLVILEMACPDVTLMKGREQVMYQHQHATVVGAMDLI